MMDGYAKNQCLDDVRFSDDSESEEMFMKIFSMLLAIFLEGKETSKVIAEVMLMSEVW